jgi:alpha-aminoadipate/glutamate carrier protein LysW
VLGVKKCHWARSLARRKIGFYSTHLLTCGGRRINIIRVSNSGGGGIMVLCPECETDLDVEEEEVDEGEIVSCPECGTDFEVVTTSPLELKAIEEGYVDEEEEVETEDGDDS